MSVVAGKVGIASALLLPCYHERCIKLGKHKLIVLGVGIHGIGINLGLWSLIEVVGASRHGRYQQY